MLQNFCRPLWRHINCLTRFLVFKHSPRNLPKTFAAVLQRLKQSDQPTVGQQALLGLHLFKPLSQSLSITRHLFGGWTHPLCPLQIRLKQLVLRSHKAFNFGAGFCFLQCQCVDQNALIGNALGAPLQLSQMPMRLCQRLQQLWGIKVHPRRWHARYDIAVG